MMALSLISLINKSKTLDVMAVAAHPDDAEIGCGGILAKLAKEGKTVGIIDLTDGEPTPYTTSREERLEEAKKSGIKLGLQVREILELPNRKLFDNFESRIALADRIRTYKPKVLLSQYGLTPHDSPDHYQAQLITEGAVFYARLSKWEEYFSFPVHRVWNLFYYVTLRENPSLDITSMSKMLIDVSNTFDEKKESLLSYKSQFRAEITNSGIIPWIQTMASYYGKQIDKKYAEVLFSPKGIEVKNLDFWLNTQ